FGQNLWKGLCDPGAMLQPREHEVEDGLSRPLELEHLSVSLLFEVLEAPGNDVGTQKDAQRDAGPEERIVLQGRSHAEQRSNERLRMLLIEHCLESIDKEDRRSEVATKRLPNPVKPLAERGALLQRGHQLLRVGATILQGRGEERPPELFM